MVSKQASGQRITFSSSYTNKRARSLAIIWTAVFQDLCTFINYTGAICSPFCATFAQLLGFYRFSSGQPPFCQQRKPREKQCYFWVTYLSCYKDTKTNKTKFAWFTRLNSHFSQAILEEICPNKNALMKYWIGHLFGQSRNVNWLNYTYKINWTGFIYVSAWLFAFSLICSFLGDFSRLPYTVHFGFKLNYLNYVLGWNWR